MTETAPPSGVVDEVVAAVRDRPDLSVNADLSVTLGGTEIQVTSYTDLVRVEIASVGDAVRVARSARSRSALGRLTRGLVATGLTVDLYVAGAQVARLGTDATPGPLARRLTGASVQYHLGGAVGALVRSL